MRDCFAIILNNLQIGSMSGTIPQSLCDSPLCTRGPFCLVGIYIRGLFHFMLRNMPQGLAKRVRYKGGFFVYSTFLPAHSSIAARLMKITTEIALPAKNWETVCRFICRLPHNTSANRTAPAARLIQPVKQTSAATGPHRPQACPLA